MTWRGSSRESKPTMRSLAPACTGRCWGETTSTVRPTAIRSVPNRIKSGICGFPASVRDVYRPMDTGYSTITVSPIPPSSRRVIARSGVAVTSSWGFRCMLSSSNWIPMRCPIIGRSSACLDASYGFHFQACTPEVSGIYRTSVSGQSKCGRNSPFGSAVGSVAQLCRIHDCH